MQHIVTFQANSDGEIIKWANKEVITSHS